MNRAVGVADTSRRHMSGTAQQGDATCSHHGAAAHLGLLGGDVAGAADAVRKAVAAAQDERTRDSALSLADTAAPAKVAAVHHREVLQGRSWNVTAGHASRACCSGVLDIPP